MGQDQSHVEQGGKAASDAVIVSRGSESSIYLTKGGRYTPPVAGVTAYDFMGTTSVRARRFYIGGQEFLGALCRGIFGPHGFAVAPGIYQELQSLRNSNTQKTELR